MFHSNVNVECYCKKKQSLEGSLLAWGHKVRGQRVGQIVTLHLDLDRVNNINDYYNDTYS